MRSFSHSVVAFSRPVRFGALLLAIAAQGISNGVLAGSPAALLPVVTDQAPLDLPNTFGNGGPFGFTGDLNQVGDFLFATRGQSGVFLRPAGAAAPVRLLQEGDEIPGYPGSRMDVIFGMRINNAGLSVYRLAFYSITGENQGAIQAFDGFNFTTVAFSGDTAPGTGGARYGSLSLTGLNDAGDVAFVAGVEIPGVFTNRTTLYLARPGSEPVRIAGLGDPAPETGGTLGIIAGIALNSGSEILFSAPIVGGGGGYGYFVGSAAGLRKVVAHGDPNPLGGVFTISGPSISAFFNDQGQTSFVVGGSLFLHYPGAGVFVAVQQGSAAPPPVGGTFGNIGTFPANVLNNAGGIAFFAPIAGSPITNSGIFRFRSDGSIDTVAYQNQIAPGTGGERFSALPSFSMNDNGQVSFRSNLSGSIRNGIFRQTGPNPAEPVALDGDDAPASGGGTFYLSQSDPLRTLEDGSVYFFANVFNGIAAFGEFLVGQKGGRALMTSAEPLPEDSRVVFRTFKVGAAGDYLSFLAARTGGLESIMVYNRATGVTAKVITEGDVLPDTGGAHFRLYSPNKVHINASGTVAFGASIAGGTVDAGVGIFLWNPELGVTKVVVPGDIEPGSGRTFGSAIFNQIAPNPLNSAGQLVFPATFPDLPFASGIFVGSATAPLRRVAFTGDPDGEGASFISFGGQQNINESGQVAFWAFRNSGRAGIFLGAPGSQPLKIVGEGDPGPAGTAFSTVANSMSLNDNGEVGFMSALAGSPSGGVFVGRALSMPEAVALNGAPSPDGSFYSGFTAGVDALINNQGDLAFRADLVGGSSNSGYFLRRAGGAVQVVALQGQPAPGTQGTFGTIPPTAFGALAGNMVLRQSGDFACSAPVIQDGFSRFGHWRLRQNDVFEKILVAGDPAPESGGGTAVATFFGANDGGEGPLVLDVGVVGGAFSEAIYVLDDSPPRR